MLVRSRESTVDRETERLFHPRPSIVIGFDVTGYPV
jgi:hypothetical protein